LNTKRGDGVVDIVSNEVVGWNSGAVIEAVEFACGESGVVVAVADQQGLLATGGDASMVVDVLAIEQGVVAILVGIAQEKGFLEVWDHLNHHLAPEWTQLSPWDEAKLSIETVLTMTTGMDDSLLLAGDINSSWRVNHVAHGYLKALLETATGLSLADISRAWLFEPLGMTNTRWFSRQQSLPNDAVISGLMTSAGDLAKLGQMLLQRGQFAGQSVLGEAHYLDDMLRPGSKENPAWGWLWWINNASHFMLPESTASVSGVPVPAAPADMYMTRGGHGSVLCIAPSLDIAVAVTATGSMPMSHSLEIENEFWRRLLAARV
jgi:CubicO group peptidase (beta-lactamase class C family)